MPRRKNKTSQEIAIAALLLNVLVLPGLGSLIAGKNSEGVAQLILFILGVYLDIFLIGIPMIIIAWIWALITGIRIVKESS